MGVSSRGVARLGGAFNGSGGEAVDVQAETQHFDQPRLFLVGDEFGRRNLAGDHIGDLAQGRR